MKTLHLTNDEAKRLAFIVERLSQRASRGGGERAALQRIRRKLDSSAPNLSIVPEDPETEE